MLDMVEVAIDSIRVSLMSQQRVVILRELRADRFLAIFIGIYEAEAITMVLQEVEVSRPLTWDLLRSVFNALNARILRVEVTELRDDTFFGNIVAEVEGRILNVDSRPSDALALAVRAHVPIYVARSVMDAAGIVPDEEIQETPAPAQSGSQPEEAAEPEEDRLSIFEDFLDKLDLNKLDQDESGEDDKE
jgi:bifunctional DNase/RNase